MNEPGRPVTPARPLTPGPVVGSLWERVRAQDAAAWQDLVQVYGPAVYEWCREMGVTAEGAARIAERVFQDAAVEIATTANLEVASGLRGLLWSRTRPLLEDRNGVTKPANDPPFDGPGLLHRLLQALRFGFEERSWQAFCRVVIHGKRPADVAVELGISADAVRVAKARVLRRVREELATWNGNS